MTLLPTNAIELYEALKRLDQIERGLIGWHEDTRAEAWASARSAIARFEASQSSDGGRFDMPDEGKS